MKIILVSLVILLFFSSYVLNIVKFCKCDFLPPYKAEVIRGIGIFVVPAGSIIGHLDLGK